MRTPVSLLPLLLVPGLLTLGCERRGATESGTRSSERALPDSAVSDWRKVNDIPVVAAAAADDDPALAEAIRTARDSLDDARLRFTTGSDAERGRWAVKWAARTAPTENEPPRVEYLWVIPRTWSEFRVEGWLANEPQHPLECGRTLHEIVSFPADEIIDWRRAPDPDDPTDTRVEGAWTTRALEAAHGAAADAVPAPGTP